MRRGKKALQISLYGCGQELLQQHIKDLNINKIPKDLSKKIDILKETVSHYKLISLSANQIQIDLRMFAMLKQQFIHPGKWKNYENSQPNNYQIIINPKLKDFQECPSIPGLRFHIWNPVHQNYRYYQPRVIQNNEIKLQQKYTQLKGFQARVFDHQIRHLEGILALDPQINQMQFSVSQQYQDNPAMHEKALLLRQELHMLSQKNMIKMMKQGRKQVKQQKGTLQKDIPQKLTKQMRDRLTLEYKKYKRNIK